MVKHIVLFKLTPFGNKEEKETQLEMMQNIFSVLPGKLPYIVEYRTGRNICPAGHAWDFVIDSLFENEEDLNAYQVSDEHQEAVKLASTIGKEKAVVDYNF
jgi:hypothetical protein